MAKQLAKSMLEDLATRKSTCCQGWATKNKQPMTLKKVVDGRTINYLAEREWDSATELGKFDTNMFKIENIADVQATSQMAEMTINPQTLMSIDFNEQGANREIDRMDAHEWAQKYLQSKKQEQPKQED